MLTAGTLTVDRLLRAHASLRGAAPAVLAPGANGAAVVLTYGELDAACRRFADALKQENVQPGDVVGLSLGNGGPFCVAMLAAMRMGAVAMPIPTSSSPAEVAYMVEHSGTRVLISEEAEAPAVEALVDAGAIATVVRFAGGAGAAWEARRTGAVRATARREPEASRPDHRRPALLLYTSGSTARPKGILLSHEAVISAGLCNAWHQSLVSADRHGIVLPMYHSNAMFLQFWAAMVAGASSYFARKFDPKTYWREMNDAGVTAGDLVSAGIRALLRADVDDRARAMRFMLYGLPLRDEEMATFESRFGCPLVMVYGLTETAACGTRSPPLLERRADRIGLPMPGWEVRILDDQGREAPPQQEGEIWLRGPAMFDGYLDDPENTAKCMRDGGLLTGDIGRFDDGGYVVFVDRKKDLIKVKGRSVASLEVEAVLREHAGVADVAVLGVPDPETDERVVAFVVCARGVDLAELRAHCTRQLSWYKVPTEFILRTALPKTSVGKVRKSELRAEILAASGPSSRT